MKTKIVYSKKYHVDIGEHVFPLEKYKLIKDRLELDKDISSRIEFIEPKIIEEKDVLLAHDKKYLDKLKNRKLSYQEILTLELPYSKDLYIASMFCAAATLLAAKIALKDKLGIHLGGGFHHAFPDHGEGFCVLNDIAIAIKKLKKDKLIKKALVFDCDLHHGNGTAFIFSQDKDVFTFSIHQENNYPFHKPKSTLDIGLPDRTKDNVYLSFLEKHIPHIINDFKPDFIMYIAGADPYENDQIGNLALTKEGLKKRDEFISRQAKNFNVPIAIVLAGGYAYKKEDTVEIQYNTIKKAIEVINPK